MILHSTLHFSVTSDDLPSPAWCAYSHSSGTPYPSPEWLLTSVPPAPAHLPCQQGSLDNASWSLSLLLPTFCSSPPTTFPYLLLPLAAWSLMPFPKILFGSKLYSLTIHHSFAILHNCLNFPLLDWQIFTRPSRPSQNFTSPVEDFPENPMVGLASFYAILAFLYTVIVILSSLSIFKSRLFSLHQHP